MTQISNFNDLIVGSGYPARLHVTPIKAHDHESAGLKVSFSAIDVPDGLKRAELRYRKHSKGHTEYALFLFKHSETDLPRDWENSTIVWSLTQPGDLPYGRVSVLPTTFGK